MKFKPEADSWTEWSRKTSVAVCLDLTLTFTLAFAGCFSLNLHRTHSRGENQGRAGARESFQTGARTKARTGQSHTPPWRACDAPD